MPGGRPRKYDNLDDFQTEIIALYTDGTTVNKLMEHLLTKHGVDVPDRTIKRRLRDWGIYKHMRKEQSDDIKERVKAFWDVGLLDADMTKILKEEGYPISARSVTRLRTSMGLKRRDVNGGRNPEPPRNLNSSKTTVSAPENSGSTASPALEATARQTITEHLTSQLGRPLQTPIPLPGQGVDRDADEDADSPTEASTSRVPAKRKPGRPRKDPSDTKKARYTPRQHKVKPPVGYYDPDAPEPDFTREEFDRISDENKEIRMLMDGLKDEADESKAKMLVKARDDAAKYRQIQQLEAETAALRIERDRLLSTAGDERALSIQVAKNAEIERLKGVIAETRNNFRDACVRVFKYQNNCVGFMDNLRRQDPGHSTELTESETLVDDLERVFTEVEIRAIRSQI